MSSIHRYGLKNNLIRWVHRHDRMATLFRSTLPGAQLSPSPRHLPSAWETEDILPGSQEALNHEEANFESPVVSPIIHEPTKTMPGQIADPAERPSARNSALPNKPPTRRVSELPATPEQIVQAARIPLPSQQSQHSEPSEAPDPSPNQLDENWQRLQTIFRKHQVRSDGTLLDAAEGTTSKTESVKPQLGPVLHEMDESKQAPRAQHPGTVFRKQHAQEEKFFDTPETTTETKSVELSAQGTTQDIEPQKLTYEVQQGLKTTFRKPQEQTDAKSLSFPNAIAAQTKSVQPVLASSQGQEPPKQGGWLGLRNIFRKHEGQTERKPFKPFEATAPNIGSIPSLPSEEYSGNEIPKPEKNWQQLQTIYRKHEEQAEAQSGAVQNRTISQTDSAETGLHAATLENEKPNLKERVLRGLSSIFRKPQGPRQEGTKSTMDPTSPVIEPALRQPAKQTNRPVELNEADQSSLPVRRSAIAIFPAKSVQRSIENIDGEAESHETKMMSENQPRLSLPASPEPAVQMKSIEAQPYHKAAMSAPDIPDPGPAIDHLQGQPFLLESAWNVQRVNAPKTHAEESPAYQESGTFPQHEEVLATGPDQVGEAEADSGSIVSREKQEDTTEIVDPQPTAQLFSDSSRTLVEILPPSRPRPTRATVVPTNPTVQRQPENRNDTDENESQGSSLVSTAIGPLPVDLWSLIGQNPPVSSDRRELPDQAPIHFSRPESFSDQKAISRQSSSASEEKFTQVAHLPEVVQRQTLPNNAATVSNDGEPGLSAQNKKTSQAEPDLNDLAQKVYAEVRRRLALEQERTRRNI